MQASGGNGAEMSPGSSVVHPLEAETDPRSRYCAVRDLTEALSAPLSAEDQTAQSMPEVSPTKWHRAHTTWFFETFVLQRFDPDHEPVEAAYQELFNSYYESVGERYPRPERGVITRPGATDVGRYRTEVDGRMAELFDRATRRGADRRDRDDLFELVELGLHHEQQHQELLLMDIKHVLSRNPLCPVYRPHAEPADRPSWPQRWIDVPGGLVGIGHCGSGFSFDNEAPRHRVHLEPFALADRLVTVGDWQAFIDDGGYQRPELWLSDGWATVQAEGWTAPLYWSTQGDEHVVHTLGGTRPLTAAEPVCHVSHYEADAYARWAGARLPTEAEWEHAASVRPGPSRTFDLDALHPAPARGGAPGLEQLTGECWQWTASAYLPYPGFAPAPGAVGEYNGKFMSGQMVLRGGSALTPPGHTRPSYRNFFPPAARWPMTGVRLATGGDPR
jgi:ergothioneine biosynthesis protein EgtB